MTDCVVLTLLVFRDAIQQGETKSIWQISCWEFFVWRAHQYTNYPWVNLTVIKLKNVMNLSTLCSNKNTFFWFQIRFKHFYSQCVSEMKITFEFDTVMTAAAPAAEQWALPVCFHLSAYLWEKHTHTLQTSHRQRVRAHRNLNRSRQDQICHRHYFCTASAPAERRWCQKSWRFGGFRGCRECPNRP